jgi:hypothetical protein
MEYLSPIAIREAQRAHVSWAKTHNERESQGIE